MYKRLVSLLIGTVFLLSFVSVGVAYADTGFQVEAKAALLMEASTGKILLEQNPHEKLPPASVTKVMTMLIIYEKIKDEAIKWDDLVTVSDHAASMGGSQIFLEPNEQMSVRDLTKSIVVASGNDAAVAMAEFIAGSEEAFVGLMNERAKQLGMNDTHFLNACGLPAEGHVTSAYDIAIMSRELITKHPEIHEFTKIWMDTIVHKTARGQSEFGLSNTNRLIKSYPGATGLKTGSTAEALYCISATAEKGGMHLISVILGAPDPNTRFGEAMRLFDYGFAGYALSMGDEAGTVKGKIKVLKGNKENVDVVVKEQVNTVVKKGKNVTIDQKVEILDSIKAPAPKGTKAGEVVYFFENNEVGRCDLVINESIRKATLPDTTYRLFNKWFK